MVLWNNPGGHRAHVAAHESQGQNMLCQRNLIEEYVSKLGMRRIWTLFFFRELQASDFEVAVLLRVPVTHEGIFILNYFGMGTDTMLGWSTSIPLRVKCVRYSLKSNEDVYCF